MNKKQIEQLVKDIVESLNDAIELVDVEFTKEGIHRYLRIFIDKEEGVTLDDCQHVSQKISEQLDKIDPIEENYFLEVSSPGLDRPLKTKRDLEKSIGKNIEIKLYKKINNKKKYCGEFIEFDEDNIEILDEEIGKIKIKRDDIAKMNLAIKF